MKTLIYRYGVKVVAGGGIEPVHRFVSLENGGFSEGFN